MSARDRWCQVPAEPLTSMLASLEWKAHDNERPASSATAALMLYVALSFVAQRDYHKYDDATGVRVFKAVATYDELQELTDLSRSKIADGIHHLIGTGLIVAHGSAQQRSYELVNTSSKRWFKLPCGDLLVNGSILAFRSFSLRSRHEFYALKIYLYFASVRDNANNFTEVSYVKINEKTGVPARHIRKAINLLSVSGLISAVKQDYQSDTRASSCNQYYLTGHRWLTPGPKLTPAA